MTALDPSTQRRLEETLETAAALHRGGDLESAESAYRVVLELVPDHPDALHLLGTIAHQRRDEEQAVELITRAIAQRPDTAIYHNSLGAALERLLRLSESIDHYRRAIALDPSYAEAWTNLGIALQRQSRLAGAAAAYRHALEVDPGNRSTHSHLLFCLSHTSDCDPETFAREHSRWAERHADGRAPVGDFQGREFDPDRRLRIGYVLPDFRHHPVASFIEPLLEAHDRDAFEVVCYADVARPDEVTKRLRSLADRWVDSRDRSDDEFAGQVYVDEIDILVDLAGHTRDHRLLAFARRPAPVQATYLGYANTTGLAAIDYRITDAWADPPGMTEHLHSEELARLPHGFLCYGPPPYAPPSPERPRREPGRVVFGSFNKASKLTPEVIALWSPLLRELPEARIVLKSVSFSDAAAQDDYYDRFAEHGVAAGRVELLPPVVAPAEHLATYERVDIALDPFPYGGATSTCEALWMGTPVVTLAGLSHAGRVGVSLLHAVGLDELIAGSTDGYVAIAKALALDPDRLAGLHGSLRERMRGSPLCDAARSARDLEDAYRAMWRRRCAREGWSRYEIARSA